MSKSNSAELSGHAKDETGKTYGKLTVIEFAYVKRTVHWLCQCECGNTVVVSGHHLRKGGVTTCGCVHYKAGGHSGSPLYKRWQTIKDRCYNPKNPAYKNYGGRGITVSERWMESFVNFLEDMGEPPFVGATVERIDNDSGYSRDNCKWATRHEQMANSRTTRLLTYKGETKCLGEWARGLGIDPKSLHYRLKKGWPFEKALTAPATPPRLSRVRMIAYNGETHCVSDWARKLGIHQATLSERLKRGWPLEDAMSCQKYGKYHKRVRK